jgi:hypothetical protein
MMAVPLCSLQGLHVHHPRLCSLQLLYDEQPFVPNQVDAGDDNNMMTPSISDEIFDNMSDGDDPSIDIHYYQNFDDMDEESFLPTDPITVRNHLLQNTMSIDYNDNNNHPVVQKHIQTMPYYKTKKINLNLVIKEDSSRSIISDIVKKVHVLRMISTHVLKLYIIKKRSIYPNLQDFSLLISKQFIINLVDVIAKLSITPVATTVGLQRKRKAPTRYDDYISTERFNYFNTVQTNAEKQEILNFLLEFVIPGNELLSIFQGVDIRNLQNIISVMAEEIVTSYHHNIVANYKSYVNKYVDSFYLNGIKYEIDEIDTSNRLTNEQKTLKKTQTYHKFRLVKSDLVEPDKSKHKSVDPFAISFIQANQRIIFPKDR